MKEEEPTKKYISHQSPYSSSSSRAIIDHTDHECSSSCKYCSVIEEMRQFRLKRMEKEKNWLKL